MENFDTITIQEISKNDMLMILQALEFTGQEKNLDEYIDLKDNIIRELAALADLKEEELLELFKK